MNQCKPPKHIVAAAYGCTRQNLHELQRQYGLTHADLGDPEKVFEVLTDHAPASPLRRSLSHPYRQEIIRTIYKNHQ